MIDGSFREHIYGAEYFLGQDFPEGEFEVIWVEYYESANPDLPAGDRLKVICLGHDPSESYHASKCFNAGIQAAMGEVLVIPDADQIVEPDFLSTVWLLHTENPNCAVYGYRFDEEEEGTLDSTEIHELKEKCILKNPRNFGGCLTVRKKFIELINGYDEHPAFSNGFHANGYDVNQRLKNLGVGIIWSPELRLYHPWHPFTLARMHQQTHYYIQLEVIEWKAKRLETRTFKGLDPKRDIDVPFPFSDGELREIEASRTPRPPATGIKAGLAVMFPGLVKGLNKLRGRYQ